MRKEISVLVFASIFVVGVAGGIIGFKYYAKQGEENKVSEDNKVNNVVQDKNENDTNNNSTNDNKNDKNNGSTNDNKNDKNNGSTNNNKSDSELGTLLTLEKIISLADNESLKLKKSYGTENALQLYNSKRSMDLELKIDNGSLKITGNNKTWKVTDIEEKVIAIENEFLYGCDISVISSLFLTEKGNLYRLYRDEHNSIVYEKTKDDIVEVKDSFFKQLDTNKEIKIGLVKLNGSEKVQAISTQKRCQEGMTCGGCETVVYMSNGEYRYVDEGLTEKYVEE